MQAFFSLILIYFGFKDKGALWVTIPQLHFANETNKTSHHSILLPHRKMGISKIDITQLYIYMGETYERHGFYKYIYKMGFLLTNPSNKILLSDSQAFSTFRSIQKQDNF